MRTARAIALLMAMALVLLPACSAPSVSQAPSAPTDTRVVVSFVTAGATGGGTGGLEALDVTTGQLLWKTQLGIIDVSRPTIANGVVYAIANPDELPHVFAVRERDGKLLWRVPVPNYSSISSITVDASTVALFTGFDLYALDPATGAQRWHMADVTVADVSGVMRHGVIYVVNYTSVPRTLMAVNARDGSIVWQVHVDVAFEPAAVTDRAIYGYGTHPPTFTRLTHRAGASSQACPALPRGLRARIALGLAA
jgi:outer membrane protein assembly factor BamB